MALPIGLVIARVLTNRLRAVGQQPVAAAFTRSTVAKQRQSRARCRLEPQQCGDRRRFLASSEQLAAVAYPEDAWSPIYRYNRILTVVAVSRLKIIQTVITVGVTPIFGVGFANGSVTGETFAFVAGASVFSLVMLYAFSAIVTRLVGVISMSADGEFIRVGYLTFWGRRQTCYIRVDAVAPFGDTIAGARRGLAAMPLVLLGGAKLKLFVPIHNATIVDAERFVEVFGNPHQVPAWARQIKKAA